MPEIVEWGEIYCLCSMLVSFQLFGSQYYSRQLVCRQQCVVNMYATQNSIIAC